MKLSQWRTVIAVLAVLVLSLCALAVLALLARAGGGEARPALDPVQAAALFSSWVTLATIAIVSVAAKSGVQHLAGGGGLKGAAAALLTPAKPEPPPEPQP